VPRKAAREKLDFLLAVLVMIAVPFLCTGDFVFVTVLF
jgi:hypothetical protein